MVLLAFVIVGNLSDVIYDYREGASMAHMIIEGSLVVASFVLITILSTGIWRQSQSIRQLKAELDDEKENGEPLRPASLEAARHGMAAVLQSQFEDLGTDPDRKRSRDAAAQGPQLQGNRGGQGYAGKNRAPAGLVNLPEIRSERSPRFLRLVYRGFSVAACAPRTLCFWCARMSKSTFRAITPSSTGVAPPSTRVRPPPIISTMCMKMIRP